MTALHTDDLSESRRQSWSDRRNDPVIDQIQRLYDGAKWRSDRDNTPMLTPREQATGEAKAYRECLRLLRGEPPS